MAAFTLTSDNQFIVPSYIEEDPDLYVYDYHGDPNSLQAIRSCQGWGTDGARVGPSEHAEFQSLQLFGVTIAGTRLADLTKDLNLQGFDGQSFRLVVNRLGHCFVDKVNAPSVRLLRVNDYFGWSKYGVKVPKGGKVWSKCDMYSGETVVDVEGLMAENEEVRGRLEEKEREMEKMKLELEVCKKELECLKVAVGRRKGMEKLLSTLMEEEKEVKKMVGHGKSLNCY